MTEQAIINSLEFARKSLEIHGKIDASQLPRLCEAVDVGDQAAGDAEVGYLLKGGVNGQGRAMLSLHVIGLVVVRCQRCLVPMGLSLDFEASFLVVPSEGDLPAPEDESDETDFLVADPQMNVWQLVEDEILLGLPLASMHENSECAIGSVNGADQKRENPFKVLQGLKLNKN